MVTDKSIRLLCRNNKKRDIVARKIVLTVKAELERSLAVSYLQIIGRAKIVIPSSSQRSEYHASDLAERHGDMAT
jgi:hypothetical protein